MTISLRNLSKTYRLNKENTVEAVRDVSLDVERREFLVITGRSGSGKTTLLNLVAGLTRPTAGQVLLDGVDLWSLSDTEQSLLRNHKIGFIFQFPSLLPSLSALENVMLPTIFGRNHTSRDVEERAKELLHIVGLSDKQHCLPRQLSAGQQQRVVVARSLINDPELLLADEATSDLDEQTEKEIMDLLAGIHASRNLTIFMVTHTTQLVSYGTRAIVMVNGMIHADDALIKAPCQ